MTFYNSKKIYIHIYIYKLNIINPNSVLDYFETLKTCFNTTRTSNVCLSCIYLFSEMKPSKSTLNLFFESLNSMPLNFNK